MCFPLFVNLVILHLHYTFSCSICQYFRLFFILFVYFAHDRKTKRRSCLLLLFYCFSEVFALRAKVKLRTAVKFAPKGASEVELASARQAQFYLTIYASIMPVYMVW